MFALLTILLDSAFSASQKPERVHIIINMKTKALQGWFSELQNLM